MTLATRVISVMVLGVILFTLAVWGLFTLATVPACHGKLGVDNHPSLSCERLNK